MEDIYKSWIVSTFIAHRGLHDSTSPENSLSSFKKAIEKGFAIELDVHPLQDGTIVVFHDYSLKRLTNKDELIENITNVEELKHLKLLNSFETIPTLQEVLDLVSNQVPLLIEVKDESTKPNTQFLKNLKALLDNYNGRFAIMSFNPYILKWFKINAPEIMRGQLSSFFNGEKINFIAKLVLKKMLLNKKVSCPHFIAYNYKDIPNKYVNKFKNIPLLVWAVNSEDAYANIAPFVDNIIFESFLPEIKE